MKVPFVDLKAQYQTIKEEIDRSIREVINNSAFIGGTFVNKFEAEFAAYIGAKNCISCGNGTDALQITLKAFNIGSGDEVIIPANSFIASSEAITAAGAKVVFCDVNDHTNNLDINLLEDKITPNTKAIIAVHLYGRPADMDAIMAAAQKYNIKVIEDAAQAHGAKYKNRTIGTISDAACFSFYPGKNLGAYGDGGAMVTGDNQLAKKMRMWANHGRLEKYNHEFEAYNSRLDGIQAAVLSVKLKHLDKWTSKRIEIAQYYNSSLKGIGDLILPQDDDNILSVYHLYVVKTTFRDELQKYLKKEDVATGIHYPIGLPFLKAYSYLEHTEQDFPVTSKNQRKLLSLPIFAELQQEQLDFVILKIAYFFNNR